MFWRGESVKPNRASMGPPEFTGGNGRESPGLHAISLSCFNGAAGIHRRKLGAGVDAPHQIRALQWGRRNSPAET